MDKNIANFEQLSGDTRIELGNHRNTWETLVDLVNGQCIEQVHCVQVTLNANEMHSVNSTSIAMWLPHQETAHNLRYDWKWPVYYSLVYPLSLRQCMQLNNGSCWVPTILPANLCQMSIDTVKQESCVNKNQLIAIIKSHSFNFNSLCNFV